MKFFRSGILLFAMLALLAILTTLFFLSSGIQGREHERFESRLRQMREADTNLTLTVLAGRFGLTGHYDNQAQNTRLLREGRSLLEPLPSFMDEEDQLLLRPILETYGGRIDYKVRLTERFKSENAVLRNSQAYFPLAAAELARQAGNAPLSGRLRQLTEAVLLYLQTADESEAGRVRSILRELEAGPGHTLPTAQAERLSLVVLHARTLLQAKPKVDNLVREIAAIPTQAASEDISRAYSAARAHRQARSNMYLGALYLLAVALGLFGLRVYRRMKNVQHELEISNEELKKGLEERRRAEEALRLYGLVFSGSTEGVLITDAHSRILAVNKAFSEITGYSADEVLGQTPAILHSGRQGREFYQNLWGELRGTGQWWGEVWNRRRNGAAYPQWMSITALRDEEGRITNYVAISSDITERKETEERIRYLAHHDALTGLPNRTLFQDRLEQALLNCKRNPGETGAVMFVDLDRFKNINDTLGHDRGDEVLKMVAERMQAVIRRIDTVSRQGGDEFVVILPQLPHATDAALVARKINTALAEPFFLETHELAVTCSIGIALFPTDGKTPQELMRNADTAMYKAKDGGRNGFRFYRADMNAEFLDSLKLEANLRHALERNELLIHYQPQFDLLEGRIAGLEALVRWNRPGHGLVPPDKFIPLAEDTGLIEPIGTWVLNEACRQVQAWHDAGLPRMSIAVNLSARQFVGQDLVETVRQALSRSGLPADCLELELTESILMKNAQRSRDILDELKAMGIKVAMDDFGTGYSSLAYLKQFPLDRLKIDRSFVANIGNSEQDSTIVIATIGLAHTLNLEVVAEGVETAAQQDFLREMDCDIIQGYHIARPLAADQAEALLRQQASCSLPLPSAA